MHIGYNNTIIYLTGPGVVGLYRWKSGHYNVKKPNWQKATSSDFAKPHNRADFGTADDTWNAEHPRHLQWLKMRFR